MKKKSLKLLRNLAIVFFIALQFSSLLGPAKVYAAPSLTKASIQDATYKYSIYASTRGCFGAFAKGSTAMLADNSLFGSNVVVLGFAGTDGGNGDGLVTCNEALNLWVKLAGYASISDFATKDLGYVQAQVPSAPNGGSTATIWRTSMSGSDMVAKFETISAQKNIPKTLPQWGDYILAETAMNSQCGSRGPASAKVVSDDSGTIADHKYSSSLIPDGGSPYMPSTSGSGERKQCDDLATILNANASGLSAAMRQAKILAAAQVFADGDGTTTGLCKNWGQGTQQYTDCLSALNDCLKPASTGTGTYDPLAQLTDPTTNATAVANITTCFMNKFGTKHNMKSSDVSAAIGKLAGAAVNAATPAPPKTSSGSGKDPCASIPANTSNSWLACSIFTAVQSMTEGMQSTMSSILYTDPASTFTDKFKTASNAFRNLGMVIVVIAGLVMVFSQAMGIEIFDAYTIKKVLPRLVIALVAMSLSFPIMKFAVTLSNDLALGVSDLINSLSASASGVGTASNPGTDIFAVITTLGAGAAGVGVLGFWGAVLLCVSLIISYLTGLIVLAMQHLFLIVCVLIAPLAIASSILPGTDKLWKLWKSNTIKLLAMFVVIMFIIKIGDFLAAVSYTGNPLLAVMAKMATLFATFKSPQIAGQLLGGIAGMASGAAYKMAGGLKAPVDKLRKQSTQVRNKQMAEGSRFRNTNSLGRFANKVTRGAALIPKGIEKGGLLNPETFRRHYSSADSQALMDKANELRSKNPEFMSGAADDAVLWSIINSGGDLRTARQELYNRGKRGDELNTATAQAERMLNSGDFASVQLAAAIQQSTTGSGYKDSKQMLETIAKVSGGNRTLAGNAVGAMRSLAGQSGRVDLAGASYGANIAALREAFDTGRVSDVTNASLQREALLSSDPYKLATQRGESARNLSSAASNFINTDADTHLRNRANLSPYETGVRTYDDDLAYTWVTDHYEDENGNHQPLRVASEDSINNAKGKVAAALEDMHQSTRTSGPKQRADEINILGVNPSSDTRPATYETTGYTGTVSPYNPNTGNTMTPEQRAAFERAQRENAGG